MFGTADAWLGGHLEKIPLVSIITLLSIYQSKSSSAGLTETQEIVSTIYSALLDGGDWLVVGFLFLFQVVMLLRQPQHIFDEKAVDKDDNTLGITHTLSFYDHNFTRAQKHMRKVDLKSNDAI